MNRLTTELRGIKLYVFYIFDKVFEEIIIHKVYLQDSNTDLSEFLGHGDMETLTIRCMEDYETD